MPLIILTGYPCSGLTHRATQLATGLQETQKTLHETGALPPTRQFKVTVVPTHDSSHPRTVYDHARTEKETRGVAYTRARRALGKDSFVILDGMNYIKGWRYQLWCEAKALGTSCCVVHVGTPIDQCVANNEERIKKEQEKEQNQGEKQDETEKKETQTEEDAYPPELLNNLIFRYEEPSTHSRWDKPLFTVPWCDAEPPIADIWTALTGIPHPSSETETDIVTPLTGSLSATQISDTASVATGMTSATRLGARARPKIKPHLATVQPTATDAGALYNFEKRTSAVVSAIRSFTLENPSAEAALARNDGRGITIQVPEVETPVFIPAHVATAGSTDELSGAGGILALPRLQRLRRQWIAMNRAYISGNKSNILTADQVGDAFVRFLNADFAGENTA
ncbi:chromatin associated protein KTI12 [Aspergillus avenaceus]|uniref:Chromatin associated protein KTI12 n=1 Tax=Aspergillus avenaceus TaxID=36643 RepID=A0A5N6TFM7_ASPAV|nr:chromatin associated protein KTI12 [Aspergillus avenaceus]